MEDKKKLGLIITIVTVLLCGCPGLCTLSYGAMTATGNTDFGAGGDAAVFGIFTICLGIILVLIPVGAGVFTLIQSRKEKEIGDIEVPPAL